jgi:hypothetical protein
MPISTVNQKGLDAPLTLTSPVLTTPNLGTPSTLVLTNATGLGRAALPAGSVLQVVGATYTGSVTTTSTSYISTGLAASITPTSSSSKILIMMSSGAMTGGANLQMNLTIYRGGSNLMTQGQGMLYTNTGFSQCSFSLLYYDSPATTSSTTYTIYYKNTNNSAGNVTWNPDSASGSATAQLILMEIAA